MGSCNDYPSKQRSVAIGAAGVGQKFWLLLFTLLYAPETQALPY